jgi:TolB-like protein/Tfp pilus assembly protein PilF
MSDERWRRVNELFQGALDRDSAERPAFLDESCSGDSALRAEVEALLSSHRHAGSFLDKPAPGLDSSEALTEDAEPRGERIPLGSRLGPYEVVGFLGAGGMGEVYRARDPRLDRDVAIKVLSGGAADQKQRLAREAKAAGALNHPNVLAVYDVGEEAGTPYVVCELLEGETLRDRLRQGAVPWRQALELASQVLSGLAVAHERGIVHRDLKPENLFFTRDGRVKILDFGLAKQGGLQPGEGAATTQAGMIRGTVGYMSPEQLRSQPADPRSDLFAFGAILYELLSGRRAYISDSPVETMSAILTQAPDFTRLEAVPRELAAVVERCLLRDPAGRYGSAREVAAALEAASLSRGSPAPAVDHEAIAVLPFLNLGGDPEQEYFCDGLAAELIHTLTGLEGLRVASLTSAVRFKGRAENLQQIGNELGVTRVLEGSVRRAGDRLRITVQLVDVASGYHVWSERYDRSAADVFAVQDEIAGQVVEALRLKLDPRQARMRRYTHDVEAYHLYLKGIHFWNKRHEGGLQKALDAFALAIEKDASYAPAWAGLADSYAIVSHSLYDILPPREAMPRAREAALRALQIDPTLAAPHATLGWIRLHYEWTWAEAEAGFSQALERDPGRAASHHWRGFLMSAMGRAEEAIAESRRAFELEPLSLIINSQLCQALYYARRFDQVADAARKVLEMEPTFAIGHVWLGQAHAAEGRFPEAIASYEAFGAHGGGASRARALVGNALARAGDRQAALAVLEELRALHARRPVPAFHLALVQVGLGDRDAAFAALETAFEERADQLPYLGVEPLLDPLRRDPRFEALLDRLALPASARRAAP